MKKQVSLFVPGRLCLFGEHSDWAGIYMTQNADIVEGQAIVTGINLGIYAVVSMSDDFKVTSFNEDGERISFVCAMNYRELKENASNHSIFSYCCGVAAYMYENYHINGVDIKITKADLPMKKGLSSSAAICCLVAKAFNELYGLHISTRGIMQIAYRGELLAGSRCGRLDQACAYGETPVLMHFAQNEIDVERLRVGKNLYWVIADLCAGKDTKKILAYLSKAYPFATDEIGEKEQEALGIDNHRIIAKAKTAIEEGDAEKLGQLMTEAQMIFDSKIAPACPDELASPVLHSVIDDPNLKPYIYGAKGVGSQGDGTVQLLAKNKEAQEWIVNYLNKERGMDAFGFKLNAGGKIKKAIIPIAGNGIRMFPQTFFTKKALLPIMDKYGIVKPALMYMLEELDDAEIEDIYLIVGKGEDDEYRKLFNIGDDTNYRELLPEKLRYYYDRIVQIGQKIHFVVQQEKKGFGHAVYQAKEYLSNEPVLLMLGDFIYKSNLDISCAQQTINAYNESGGKAVISIKRVPIEDCKNYGIVHGKFMLEKTNIMEVDEMVEKPDAELVKDKLAVDGDCFATFGQYVLTDQIFRLLEEEIEMQKQGYINGEVNITKVLMSQAEKGELVGIDIDGESFDVGLPEMYYKTFQNYRYCGE